MASRCQINLLDTEYTVQMINSDNYGWITVYGLSACFLPFEKSERCAYKRPTVLNIDSLSQFVLRNQSAQGRKSLWEINTLTFLGSIDLKPHLSVFILKRQTESEFFLMWYYVHILSLGYGKQKSEKWKKQNRKQHTPPWLHSV